MRALHSNTYSEFCGNVRSTWSSHLRNFGSFRARNPAGYFLASALYARKGLLDRSKVQFIRPTFPYTCLTGSRTCLHGVKLATEIRGYRHLSGSLVMNRCDGSENLDRLHLMPRTLCRQCRHIRWHPAGCQNFKSLEDSFLVASCTLRLFSSLLCSRTSYILFRILPSSS